MARISIVAIARSAMPSDSTVEVLVTRRHHLGTIV